MYTQENLNDGLVYLHDYHRYWLHPGERNPAFDDACSRILNLKKLDATAIASFYQRLNKLIVDEDIAICYVPSSTAGNLNTGIKQVAVKLTNGTKRINATSCLVRHTTIPKLATGGDRSTQKHLNSINVTDKNLIVGKRVLLLDDITTTNHSLEACAQLLMEAGATKVYQLALGRTVRE